MLLHSDCLLLLSNNSLLQVHNNRDRGIFSAGISVLGTLKRAAASSLELWPENDHCFFQFVDNHGRYIHSYDLHNFNVSISVCDNKLRSFWRYATNNIWNGHFDNCLLQTQEGSVLASNTTLTHTFRTDLIKLQEESTLPYKICLCDSTLVSRKASDWDCQQRIIISAYPGQAKLSIALHADFNRTVSGLVTLAATKKDTNIDIANCTLIPLQWLKQPFENDFILLTLTEYHDDCPFGTCHA